ncbi:VOC family protein [Candidatus Palauibacter soopunensis]|uniref:VOC family protein n=1 Tax=Candidatus Palauibacter soopunensis TaxID=3056739 RepID=UPI0023A22A7A|nr:VOC family protein [Candidatus Palauibacter soopunensis]MDE2879952.1 glyoxalase/bleomycin resistance/extradiol dioxygenase family protein [Candidatus Palauibacter soopunensis]
MLPSRDVAAAIGFYVGRLGFELAFADSTRDPGYAGVRRDGIELHLQWHDAEEWSRVERPMLRFVVPAVEDLFEEYRDQGVFHERTALRRTLSGTREFAFYDLDMNGLTFYRALAEGETPDAPEGEEGADRYAADR